MRRTRLVDLDPDAGYRLGPGLGSVLAFSVGGERLIGALVDAAGHADPVVYDDPQPRQLLEEPSRFLQRLRDVGESVLRRALESPQVCRTTEGAPAVRLIGASVAWPAPMLYDTMPARGAQLEDGWHRRTFREHLSYALGLPLNRCHAINDANAGALTLAAEQHPSRPGAVMCLHLSAGIGVGTVLQAIAAPRRAAFIDAHVVGGRDNRAGEIGHCVLDEQIVRRLNARLKGPRWKEMRKLDSHRRCNCDPDARGHLEAVLGAEAVLRRLGRYQEGDSLVRRLKELHQDASQPHVREALGDVGRGVASVMAGSIATTDPVQVALAGALAHQHIVDAMNEQLDDYDVSTRVALYRGTNGDLVGLRGAALAVLRGGLYRGFFSYARHSPSPGVADDLPEGWRGWDEASPGAQSGRTGRGDSAWVYRPLLIDEAAVDRLSEKALESDPKVSKAVA